MFANEQFQCPQGRILRVLRYSNQLMPYQTAEKEMKFPLESGGIALAEYLCLIILVFTKLQNLALVQRQALRSAPNCIKHFHWLIRLFWPIRYDVTIVSIGNNCNVKPDCQESQLGIVVKSNLISQNHLVNQGNPLYNWVQEF